MVQFHVLSGKFDEEKKLEPLKCGRVDDIKRTYEKQLQKLNRMGVDMTQSEVRDLELSELLVKEYYSKDPQRASCKSILLDLS